MTTAITDHVRLWADDLSGWLPSELFDAHVHLGLPGSVGSVAPERRRSALLTFTAFSWEDFRAAHAALFPGRALAGLFAFPFPQREVALGPANDYIIALMQRDARLRGFLLSDPRDPAPAIAAYDRALAAGVRFAGVKPYADRLGKSNFAATMAEFLPEGLLEFMDDRRLIMLLHTAGMGVGTRDCQDFLRGLSRRWPGVRVVLAHMGRYVRPEQFLDFMASGVLEDCPTLRLEMSSASCVEVYESVLQRDWLWPRLLFGTDLPFGLITGIEHWSDTHGAIFLTRDEYAWSDPALLAGLAAARARLTYNAYHTIKALKDAMTRLGLTTAAAEDLKHDVFCRNAQRLLLEAAAGTRSGTSGGQAAV